MTRVDFYILSDDTLQACPRCACRLAEKAYLRGLRVYVHTDSPAQTALVDELLWSFRAGSFVPHEALPRENGAEPPPVLVGHQEAPDSHGDVLINLSPDVPAFFSRFTRVAELVDAEPERRRQGRERYRFYRERGYELTSHEIDGR